MPPYSFVLPVLDEADTIESQLLYLREHYPAAEVVVVDGGSSDGTPDLAAPLCDLVVAGERGRGVQMQQGAGAARGEYLFFLHADSRPSATAAQLLAYLGQHPAWGFCCVRLSGQRRSLRMVEWAMNHRSRLTSVATGDQMLFVRADLYRRSGGFAAIPLMEDVEYCKRLRRLAPPLVIAQPVVTSSRRWESGGVGATVLQMWLVRLAWFLGIAPQRLYRHYYGEDAS